MRDFLSTLFKRKGLILTLFFTGIIAVTAGVYIWPETYEAEAKILVKLGRENISVSNLAPSAQTQVMASLQVRAEDINSEIGILQNRQAIEKLVDTLGIDYLAPKVDKPLIYQIRDKIMNAIKEALYYLKLKKRLPLHEKLVLTIAKNLNVEQIQRSDIIGVTFQWSNPEVAREVVRVLIDLFLQNHITAHKTSEDFSFLQQQVSVASERLNDLEGRLEELKFDENIISFPDQQRLLLERKAELEALKKKVETDMVGARKELEEYSKELASESEVVKLDSKYNRNPILDPLKMKLLDLELDKRKLENKFKKGSPPLVAIENEIKKVKARLAAERASVTGVVTMGVNAVYEKTKSGLIQTRVRMAALKEKHDAITKQMKWYDAKLKRLSFSETELKRLDRLIEIETGNYKLYRKRLEEARVSNLLDARRVVNVKIIDPPSASMVPTKPNKLMVIGLGILLSLITGIALAILFDYMDHTIETAEDVDRHLGLRVLSSIPEGANRLHIAGDKK